ncbi:MAG: MFS transporter, partial [Desulfobacteraceae bacterium]|nr:MFS transporter [Desulfobacteraceae bacterium]
LKRAGRTPRFLLALCSTTCFFTQSFGVNLIWPFFLEAGGMTPGAVGVRMLIPSAMLMVAGPICGRLSDRRGYDRVSWLGCLVLAAASWGQGLTGLVVVGLVGIGLGRALFLAANNVAVLSQAPEGTAAVASCLLSIARVSGQALGSILAGFLWALLAGGGSRRAFMIINLVLGGVAIVAGLLIAGRKRLRTRVPCPSL